MLLVKSAQSQYHNIFIQFESARLEIVIVIINNDDQNIANEQKSKLYTFQN